MALSEDQTALLRLLLAGDTYERVADVLGTTPEDVRERAQAAAAEAEADPGGEFRPDEVNARLAALEGSATEATPAPPALSAPRQRWALWIAAGAAAVTLVVVLVVTTGGGGGGDGGSAPTPNREDVVPVKMTPVGGSRASGTIAIVRVGDQPAVDLAIQGLPPTEAGQTYVLWFVGSGNRSLPVAFQGVGG